jgi:hypothetical protein
MGKWYEWYMISGEGGNEKGIDRKGEGGEIDEMRIDWIGAKEVMGIGDGVQRNEWRRGLCEFGSGNLINLWRYSTRRLQEGGCGRLDTRYMTVVVEIRRFEEGREFGWWCYWGVEEWSEWKYEGNGDGMNGGCGRSRRVDIEEKRAGGRKGDEGDDEKVDRT